jgi:hypothetical protein
MGIDKYNLEYIIFENILMFTLIAWCDKMIQTLIAIAAPLFRAEDHRRSCKIQIYKHCLLLINKDKVLILQIRDIIKCLLASHSPGTLPISLVHLVTDHSLRAVHHTPIDNHLALSHGYSLVCMAFV